MDIRSHDSDLGAVSGFGQETEEQRSRGTEEFKGRRADEQKGGEAEGQEVVGDYLFEPKASKVLDFILPRLVEIITYQAVLETEASEHSARMMAMRNANEAAGDMISELILIYNKARQASITKELAEIAGGAAALEN